MTQVLTYAFAILTAWNLAQLTWLVLLPQTAPLPPSAAPNVHAPSSNGNQAVVQRIMETHLFGTPNNNQSLPETRLALVLLGTYALGNGRGYAIIAPAKGQQAKVYATGSKLPGNVELGQVLDDRVLLRTTHGEEALKLTKSHGGAPLLRPVPASNAAPSQVEDLRRQLLTNPLALRRYINAEPIEKNGKIKGFRVAPRSDPALFNSFGLHAGDIVTSINGVALNDTQRLPGLLAKLHTAQQITLTVERNGKPVTIKRSLR